VNNKRFIITVFQQIRNRFGSIRWQDIDLASDWERRPEAGHWSRFRLGAPLQDIDHASDWERRSEAGHW
jgi:hypothetical protein